MAYSKKQSEKYDAKMAYNKNLSDKARLHYLENNIADHKGPSASKSMLNLGTPYKMGMKNRGPLDKISNPIKGNAFIKAKVDAEARGDKSFEVGGKTYPIQMKGDSPMEASYSKGPKMPTPLNGYESDAQRKAVHASKADGGKGNPNKMVGNAKKTLKSAAIEGAAEGAAQIANNKSNKIYNDAIMSGAMEGISEKVTKNAINRLKNKKDVYYSNDAGKALPPKFENEKQLFLKELKELPKKKSQGPTMKVPLMMPKDPKKMLKTKINKLSDQHKDLYDRVIEGYGPSRPGEEKKLYRIEDRLKKQEEKYKKKFGGSPYDMGHKK